MSMQLVALPGEITAWHRQLAPLPRDRRHAVIRWLSEVVVDCHLCGDPVRRVDSRGHIGGGLAHLRCAPPQHLGPVQLGALDDREAQ
jgi:hypothetical protein